MVVDKRIIMQIFGCLLKQPLLLNQIDAFRLDPTDFPAGFERYIFCAIANMAADGAQNITIADIDNYFVLHPDVYRIFNKYNGIEYLQDAQDLAQPENFKYYYNKLKKFNLLNELAASGYDTNKIYPEKDLLDEHDYELREKFEELTISDIFTSIKSELAQKEEKYSCLSIETGKANTGIIELLQSFKEGPDVGAPMQGDIFNTLARGARKGKFYILSAGSGVGKTRTMIANAAYIAYPIRYDNTKNQWVSTGSCEKVMYIGTEQKKDEIQTLILAYLSGINEEIIMNGQYDDKTWKRLMQAKLIMDTYADNFVISRLPEPSLNEVKTHIRSKVLGEKIENIFYDYIFATPSLLNEFRDLSIRPDVALRLLSTLLKDLAAELNIFVMSATQLTGKLDYTPGYIRNELMLRDSKSIADKADLAMIRARVLPEELNQLATLCSRHGVTPNQVTDVYKNRRGKFVEVRIWSKIDLGTMRIQDLFITDANFDEIRDFEIKKWVFEFEEMNYMEVLDKLNEEIEDKPPWDESPDYNENCNQEQLTVNMVENSSINEDKQEAQEEPHIEKTTTILDWDELLNG